MKSALHAPKYISIVIVLFWLCNFAQVPQLREDYPFSFFGMYKKSILNTAYSKFTVHIREKGTDVYTVYPVGTFAFLNALNAIVLREKKLKNREYVVPPKLLSEQKPEERPEIPLIQVEKMVSELVSGAPGIYEIQIVYEEWKKLNSRTMSKPDYRHRVTEHVVQIDD